MTQENENNQQISWQDFEKIELRVGTITRVEEFPEARKPAWKLWLDTGEGRLCTSSAQITDLYTREDLLGRQVICVCNFPVKKIAGFRSEVLVTGFIQENGSVVLAVPERPVLNGLLLR